VSGWPDYFVVSVWGFLTSFRILPDGSVDHGHAMA